MLYERSVKLTILAIMESNNRNNCRCPKQITRTKSLTNTTLMLLIGLYLAPFQECTAAQQQYLSPDHVLVQQRDKIPNSHGGYIGTGVDIAADGKTLFASNSLEDDRIGMLMDTRANATTEEFVLDTFVQTMTNNSNGTSGYPTFIATSDDGSTVALVSSNTSHEFVHILSGTLWSNSQTFAVEKTGYQEMPPSIAISGSGQTIVFGSGSVPDEPLQPKCVQLFQFIGGAWNVTELPLLGVQTEDFITQRRCQVDISANGNTLLVGLPWLDQGMGGVLSYMRKRGNTYLLVSRLLPLEQTMGFGDQLAVNHEGNVAIGFSQTADMRRGAFWAFQQHPYIPEQWFPVGEKYTINDPTLLPIFIGTGLHGPLVAKIGADETIAIGISTYDSNKGAVWLFRRKEGSMPSWEQIDQRLDPVGEAHEVQFGSSLAFSQEGTLVVGARDIISNGSVWLFRAIPGAKTAPSTSPTQSPIISNESEASIVASSLAGVFGGLLLLTWFGVGAAVYWNRKRKSAAASAVM